jgi:hypothetical protein
MPRARPTALFRAHIRRKYLEQALREPATFAFVYQHGGPRCWIYGMHQ